MLFIILEIIGSILLLVGAGVEFIAMRGPPAPVASACKPSRFFGTQKWTVPSGKYLSYIDAGPATDDSTFKIWVVSAQDLVKILLRMTMALR